MEHYLTRLKPGDPVRITILRGGYWHDEVGGRFVKITQSGLVQVKRWDRKRVANYAPENVRPKD